MKMSEGKGEDSCSLTSLGITAMIFMLLLKYCVVSVSSDHGGASKAAMHHTPLDLVSLASQIQEVNNDTIVSM